VVEACFWCGSPKGDDDGLAYRVYDYRPCATCEGQFSQGVVFFEMDLPEVLCRPSFDRGMAPTGRYRVVAPYFVAEALNEPLASQIIRSGRCYVRPADFEKLFPGESET